MRSSNIHRALDAAMNSATVVDRSSVGKIRVLGSDALDLLHRLTTNDLLNLKPHQARTTVFTTDKGRIVDCVRVLVFPDYLLLITSPGQEYLLKNWIDKYTIMEDVHTSIVSSDWAMFSFVGPSALSMAESFFNVRVTQNSFEEVAHQFGRMTVEYQAEFGVAFANILVPREIASQVMTHLTEGQGRLDLLDTNGYECFRIIWGLPQGGHELSESFNPYEAGLIHAISFTKGCYIGQEVIARLDTYQKVQRRLVGLSFDENSSPISEMTPLFGESGEVGVLTSLAPVPLHGKRFALGVVRMDRAAIGDVLLAGGEGSTFKGVVTDSFERRRQ